MYAFVYVCVYMHIYIICVCVYIYIYIYVLYIYIYVHVDMLIQTPNSRLLSTTGSLCPEPKMIPGGFAGNHEAYISSLIMASSLLVPNEHTHDMFHACVHETSRTDRNVRSRIP